MKRSSVIALVLGALASVTVIALHATGVTLPLEEVAISPLAKKVTSTKVVGITAQYALVVALSFGVSWLVVHSKRRRRLAWPLSLIAVELILLAWICSLYGVFFQPLPSLLAVVLAFVAANGYAMFGGRVKPGTPDELFTGRLADERIAELPPPDVAREAKSYEITAVVCDIANKHDLAEERSPAEFAELTREFLRQASASFIEAGAYIDSANGEGIVAIFGFPEKDGEQAEKATRHALALIRTLSKKDGAGRNGSSSDIAVYLGISTGTIVAAPFQRDGGPEILMTGEPVELARRFCSANRFYGSRILIGPATFESCSKNILARPIDFLSGVDVRERHEIYEPLSPAADATPEEVERRDSFWNGVVLYREKRWAEAYSQFQKACGPDEHGDAPLQLYLRRIEPLALHLAMAEDE